VACGQSKKPEIANFFRARARPLSSD
jgi:predicted RNase H-like HicB family nuclease